MNTNILSSLKSLIPSLPGSQNSDIIEKMAPSDSNKRKRGTGDQGAPRQSPSIRNAAAAAAAAVAAANQHSNDVDSQFENLSQLISNATNEDSVQQNGAGQPSAAQTAQAALTHYQVPASFESSGAAQDGVSAGSSHFGMEHAFPLGGIKDTDQSVAADTSSVSQAKPPVGSEEWHRIRRDNHKEVERRRREAINEGINELSKIVPGCEKNKGSILQRAVQYIGQLKENEQANIEKWTLEKLLLDQAVSELSAQNDRWKAQLDYVTQEKDAYRAALEENSIEVPVVEEKGDVEKEK